MSKVLCPVDFSTASLNAIEFATRIAEKQNSSLLLVHSFTAEEFNRIVGSESIDRNYRELLEAAEQKLQNLAKKVRDMSDSKILACQYEVLMGNLTEQILRKLGEEEFDLIVMGTTGISATGMSLGSNTSKIIEKSPVPVFCVPENASYVGFKKIIYATDYQPDDKKALQDVVSFAILFDARINVVHLSHHQAEEDREAFHQFMEELKSFVQYDKISYDIIFSKDQTSLALEDYFYHQDADLLVLLSKRRNFLENLFHKSVTRQLSFVIDKPFQVIKI